MKMFKKIPAILIPIAFPLAASAGSLDMATSVPGLPSAADAAGTLACVNQSQPYGDYSATLRVTRQDSDGETLLANGQIDYRGARNARMIRFVSRTETGQPGPVYLMRQEDQDLSVFAYLPDAQRVRRILPSQFERPLLDSAITLRDLEQLLFGLGAPWQDYGGKLGQREVSRLNFPPKPDQPDLKQARAWIDQQTCLPLKVRLEKVKSPNVEFRIDPATVQKIGEQWIATSIEVRSERDSAVYRFEIDGLKTKQAVSGRTYRSNTFFLGAF